MVPILNILKDSVTQFVRNKAKKRISKLVLQENKIRQIFPSETDAGNYEKDF